MRRDTNVQPLFIRSPRPPCSKNISAMAKQITLKAPGNRQSLQSMSSGSPVGHRTFWPLIPDDRTGFWRRLPSRPRALPPTRNALSFVYFSRQLMTNCGRFLAAGPFVRSPALAIVDLFFLLRPPRRGQPPESLNLGGPPRTKPSISYVRGGYRLAVSPCCVRARCAAAIAASTSASLGATAPCGRK